MTRFFDPPSGTTDPVATPSPASPDSSRVSPDLVVHRTAITRRDNHTRNTDNGRYLKGDRKK